mmetsp:Transcript_43172/g.101931  ORF Transcript_43172/g.101931 Transcript_43172/m.101931 type:complete len:157 (-) Transcript_43172:105-575(-)
MQKTLFGMRMALALFALAGVASVAGHAGHSMNRAPVQSRINMKSNLALRSVASELDSSASFASISEDDSEVECTSTFCDDVCTCKKVDFTASKRADWAPKPLRRSSSVTSSLNSESTATANSYSAAHSVQNSRPRTEGLVREFTRLQSHLFPDIAF